MFESKKIKEIENRLDRLEDKQETFIKHITAVLEKIQDSNKAKYVWELREEEIMLQEDGKKLRKIRKILE